MVRFFLQAQKILSQIGLNNVHLSDHEMAVAAQLVDPKNIPVSWDSIAGLDDVVQEIKETVILPIRKRHLFAGNSLIEPPKGREGSCRFERILPGNSSSEVAEHTSATLELLSLQSTAKKSDMHLDLVCRSSSPRTSGLRQDYDCQSHC